MGLQTDLLVAEIALLRKACRDLVTAIEKYQDPAVDPLEAKLYAITVLDAAKEVLK